jgi:hypothetical protein
MWLLQALGLGMSILISVDPETTPTGVWEQAAPILFGDDGTERLPETATQE